MKYLDLLFCGVNFSCFLCMKLSIGKNQQHLFQTVSDSKCMCIVNITRSYFLLAALLSVRVWGRSVRLWEFFVCLFFTESQENIFKSILRKKS